MNILSPHTPAFVLERIRALVQPSVFERSAAQFAGDVAARGFVIRKRPRRIALPWRATFRGAALSVDKGTLIAGKFDSNWSLYFIGYPIAAAVFVNVVLNLVSGRVAGRLFEFALFVLLAVCLCACLALNDRRDKRVIAAALCDVVDGHIEADDAPATPVSSRR